MPRNCTVCHSEHRSEIEFLMVSGDLVSRIARAYPVLSDDALYRHLHEHLDPQLRAGLGGPGPTSTTSLIRRMADVADDARRVREAALAAGAHQTALRAGDAELRAIGTLMARLGIDELSVVSGLEEAGTLASAIGHVSRTRPELAEAVADRLDAIGQAVIARAIRDITDHSREIEGAHS